jgi:hypothetical protein
MSAADRDPLDHVNRPLLPWRTVEQTECGLDTNRPVITRDEFQARFKRLGRRRTAMTVCMTCWGTATRWPSFDEDPVRAVQRETYMMRSPLGFREELLALAELVANHRGEFEALVAALRGTVDLAGARRRRGGAA